MKAIVVREHGGVEKLELTELALIGNVAAARETISVSATERH